MTRIEEERIDEMLAGLEGVTPGPWRKATSGGDTLIIGHPSWTCARNGVEGEWEVARLDNMVGEHPKEVRANSKHIARCDPNTIRSLLLELKELRAQLGVRVKGLEWVEQLGTYTASTPFGSLVVRGVAFEENEKHIAYAIWGEEEFCTVSEAKAAAEADYRTRILSALETEAVEPVAWRCWVRDSFIGVTDYPSVAQEWERLGWMVIPLYAHPPHSSIPTVTGAMIDTAAHALEAKLGLGQPWEEICEMADIALTAALSEESKP